MESIAKVESVAGAGGDDVVVAVAENKKYLYECPDNYEESDDSPTVFLAGGITGCPDWQTDIKTRLLETCPGLFLFNPRRATFDVNDENAFDIQVTWEHRHLKKARCILFWFPCETLCPITLLEIGKWMVLAPLENKHLIVGCHPKYTRRKDVQLQLNLQFGRHVQVHSSLDEIFREVRHVYDSDTNININPLTPSYQHKQQHWRVNSYGFIEE